MFSDKVSVAFLFLSVTSGFHLVVNPIFTVMKLTVDFENDVPTSQRVFLTWLDVVKGFSSPRKEFCNQPL